MIWINKNKTKFIDLEGIKAFYFSPQYDMELGKHVENLRVLLNGGDMWFDGEDAKELYNIIIENLKKETNLIK